MQETKSLSWLQRLKDESWEAELLISAVSIFAILSAFTPLSWLVSFLIDRLPPNQYFYGFMISFGGYLALGILGVFFITHLGLRAYWIGLVGLNSVFPDYSLKDSAYSEIYTKKMSETLPKLPETISALDDVCSVLFSAAFAFLLLYVNTNVISGILLWIYNVASEYNAGTVFYYAFIAFLILFALANIFSVIANFKKYKSHERIQTWYYHSAIWTNKALLGPFYLYMLQITMIFGSNFKKKKSVFVTIFITMAFGIGFAVFQLFQSDTPYLSHTDSYYDKSRIYPHHYQTNNAQRHFLFAPEIQSEIITEPVIKIFVPLLRHQVSQMEKACKLNKANTADPDSMANQERWQWNLDCYASKVSVLIDGYKVTAPFAKIDHAVTKQLGLFAFIDLAALEHGTHQLTVVKDISEIKERTPNISFYFAPESDWN